MSTHNICFVEKLEKYVYEYSSYLELQEWTTEGGQYKMIHINQPVIPNYGGMYERDNRKKWHINNYLIYKR